MVGSRVQHGKARWLLPVGLIGLVLSVASTAQAQPPAGAGRTPPAAPATSLRSVEVTQHGGDGSVLVTEALVLVPATSDPDEVRDAVADGLGAPEDSVTATPVPDSARAASATSSASTAAAGNADAPATASAQWSWPSKPPVVHDVIPRTKLEGFTLAGFEGGAPGAFTWTYNGAADPLGGGTSAIVASALGTWSTVDGSNLRLVDGGATTRCPSLLVCSDPHVKDDLPDGHNDIAWVDIVPLFDLPPDSYVFGLSNWLIGPDGHAVEADIDLNSGVPSYAWTTDGTFIDVESVLMHELGHTVGLGHSGEPSSVMHAGIPGAVTRTLGDLDRAAVQHLYPADGVAPRGPILPAPGRARGRVLATVGAGAPGGGRYADHLIVGDLNDRGELALVSGLAIGRANLGEGVFRVTPHLLWPATAVELARSGGKAPGGGRFGPSVVGDLAIDSNGRIAFAFQRPGSDEGVGAAVYISSAAGKALRALTAPGQVASDGTVLLGALDVDLSDSGIVSFAAPISTGAPASTADNLGIFTVPTAGGPVQARVVPGGQIDYFGPTVGLTSVSSPSLAADGLIAFGYADEFYSPGYCSGLAWSTPGVCEQSTGISDPTTHVNYWWTDLRYNLSDPTQPMLGYPTSFAPRTNDHNDELVAAVPVLAIDGTRPDEGDAYGTYTAGLYYWPHNVAHPTVSIEPGNALPGGGHFLTATFFMDRQPWRVNNNGDFAFIGQLNTDPIPTDGPMAGVYATRGGTLKLVARPGTTIPGIGTIAKILGSNPSDDGALAPGSYGLGFNNKGQVAFTAQLRDGRVVALLLET